METTPTPEPALNSGTAIIVIGQLLIILCAVVVQSLALLLSHEF